MQFKLTSAAKFAALTILAASAAPALAQSAGSFIASAGWFHISPRDSSTPVTITSTTPPTVLTGSGAGVGSADTLGLSLSYFVTDNWSASFDFGVPPKFTLKGSGILASYGKLGTAKQYSPALVGKYNFGAANAPFRPFLGLGITHVSFKNIQLTDEFQHLNQAVFGNASAVSSASLSSSWKPVFTAGLGYAFNKDWYASFSVSYIPLKSTASITTTPTSTNGTGTSTATVTLNPVVTFLNVGYRF